MRGTAKALLASLMLLVSPIAMPTVVAVASELSDAYNLHTDADFRKGLQMRLAWTGDYQGGFDADIGAGTLRAIREFQARNGFTADGVMDESFLRLLIDKSDAALHEVGFSWANDPVTGVRVGLPLSVVGEVGPTEVGKLWRSADGAVEIETVRFADGVHTFREIFDVLSQPNAGREIASATFGEAGFTITGTENGRSYHVRFAARGGDFRGFSVAYDPNLAAEIEPYVAVASNSFEPFANPATGGELGPMAGLPGSEQAAEQSVAVTFDKARTLSAYRSEAPLGGAAEAVTGVDRDVDSSGTGFVVSHDGWLLTNAHVAKSCKTVLVGDLGPASQIITDEAHDLALVHVNADLGEPLAIAGGKPRLGEDVLALGFPLRSILADSLNVTRGNVSSLLGLMNDPNYLQISAPVQPGNSGGPLIDLSGRVVGVVTAKLNAVAVADLTGDIPQAINFAIRPDTATRFLTDNGIDFETADAAGTPVSVPDATAKVQNSILPILCLGGAH